MISEALIKAIEKQKPPEEPTSRWLALQLSRVDDIRRARNKLALQREDAKDALKERLRAIEQSLLAVQNTCPHYERTFHGDPSGNNDSWTCCDICGASL